VDVFKSHVAAVSKAAKQLFLFTQIGQFFIGKTANMLGVIDRDVLATAFIVQQVVFKILY
jgi:hypothetical protein